MKTSTPLPTPLARRWFLRECGIGVGKMAPYDFTEAEIADLKACAALMAGKL